MRRAPLKRRLKLLKRCFRVLPLNLGSFPTFINGAVVLLGGPLAAVTEGGAVFNKTDTWGIYKAQELFGYLLHTFRL